MRDQLEQKNDCHSTSERLKMLPNFKNLVSSALTSILVSR